MSIIQEFGEHISSKSISTLKVRIIYRLFLFLQTFTDNEVFIHRPHRPPFADGC